MGYVKLLKADAKFDLLSADNVGSVKVASGDITVQYLSGYKVTIDGAGTLVQKDVDLIIDAMDKINGASGPGIFPAMLSGLIAEVTTATL
tara:strand:- start:4122 stop:4391 length:270 start_codon:yes stop_codon:yes gene_type:complete